MNQPDITTQRNIIDAALKSIEVEIYSFRLSGEALKTIGLVEKATEVAEKLAQAMKLHAFYSAKLAELSTSPPDAAV